MTYPGATDGTTLIRSPISLNAATAKSSILLSASKKKIQYIAGSTMLTEGSMLPKRKLFEWIETHKSKQSHFLKCCLQTYLQRLYIFFVSLILVPQIRLIVLLNRHQLNLGFPFSLACKNLGS